MSDQNLAAIRAKLRYETIEDFIEGYARFISAGGMFIPMKPGKLKPIGTTIRFQFLLGDGATALLGEGVVLQVREPDDASPQSPVGMLIKFTKLAQESKALVERIVSEKAAGNVGASEATPDIHNDRTPMPSENIYNDRTPLPPDKESYERKTRESFDKVSLGQLLASSTEDPGVHEKRTDSGTDLSRMAASLDSGHQVSDAFESEEEANDALVAAAIAVASDEPDALTEESEPADGEEPESATPAEYELDLGLDFDSLEPGTAENPLDPETREAPEAPVTVDEIRVEAPRGPMKLGETEGGLKILAFDDNMDKDALKALEHFSFGGEESEIDDMFDGLFGGGDDGGDAFGGLFGGEASAEPAEPAVQAEEPVEPMPSIEMEVPRTLTEEVGGDDIVEEALFAPEDEEEEFLLEAPAEVEPEAAMPELAPEVAEGSDEAVDELPAEPRLEVAEEDEEGDSRPSPGFSLSDLGLDDDEPEEAIEPAAEPLAVEPEEAVEPLSAPSFELDELGEEAAELPQVDRPSVEVSEPELDEEPISEGIEPSFIEAEESSVADERPMPAPPRPPHEDIGSLLNSFDEPSEGFSIGFGSSEPEEVAPVVAKAVEEDDGESLEFLLASARRGIEEKSSEEHRESGDLLDQLLGDELPPPPSDAPAFALPQPDKKKKGFLSKFFDK